MASEDEMTGTLALHGGAEFHPTDDAFLAALLRAAFASAGLGDPADRPLRVVLVTTALARHDPAGAADLGTRALEHVAARLRRRIAVGEARAIDAASAADPEIVGRIDTADLVYLPGGDPGVVLDVLTDSPALAAIRRVWRRGAAVAGASAGAMAFGRLTWTPGGIRTGFGWAGDLLVVPHAGLARLQDAIRQRATIGEPRIALLGLAEGTGVIRDGLGRWRVEGVGAAWWVPPGSRTPIEHRAGEPIEISAVPHAAA